MPYQYIPDSCGGCAPYYPAPRTRVKYKTPKKVKKALKKYKRTYNAARRFKSEFAKNFPKGSESSVGLYGANWGAASKQGRALRTATGYTGDGDYWSDMQAWGRKHVPKGTFASAGGWLGSMAPAGWQGAGSALGSAAGHALSRYVGFGDYGQTVENQLVHGSGQAPLSMNATSDLSGDVIVTHREFLGNVNVVATAAGSTGFSIASYPINPGMVQSFPWLAQIANNFEMYEFAGLMYQYIPTSGEFGSTSSNVLGKVVMVTNYDPDAPAFTSTVQMENYDYASVCKPSLEARHGVETAPAQRACKQMYIRQAASTKDKLFTDLGLFQIATEGINVGAAGTFNVGELWVTYTVKFSRAQLYNSLLGSGFAQDEFISYASAASMNANTVVNLPVQAFAGKYQLASLAPTQMAPRLTNTIGAFIFSDAGAPTLQQQVIFPRNIVSGLYRIRIATELPVGANYNFSAPVFGATSRCSIATIQGAITGISFPGNNTITVQSVVGVTRHASQEFFIRVNAPGVLQAFFNIVALNACTNAQVFVIQIAQADEILAA